MAANYFLQTLTPLFFSIALLLAAAANTARSQTTMKNVSYDFTGQQFIQLDYQGDAHYVPDSGLGLRLTRTNASGYPGTYSVGRVMIPELLSLWDAGEAASFYAQIDFIITPVDSTPADGFVFFIGPYGTTIPDGSAGANLGVFSPQASNSDIFAVEFDTFFNEGTDDVNSPHVGIDIGSPVSSSVTAVGDAILGQVVRADITYTHSTRLINVRVTAGSKSFEMSYERDLRDTIPKLAQFGVAAATGGSVAVHDCVRIFLMWAIPIPTGLDAANHNDNTIIRQVV